MVFFSDPGKMQDGVVFTHTLKFYVLIHTRKQQAADSQKVRNVLS